MSIKYCATLLAVASSALTPVWGQDFNSVLDVTGASISWSGPPGAFVSSEGGAAAGETFVRLLNGPDPSQRGWLAMEVTGPAWVDFQFRPFDGTVSTSTAGLEVWPYRVPSIAGARWNAGTVFLPPGPNRLEWAGRLYDGLSGTIMVDVDDVRIRRNVEMTVPAALNFGSNREWRTSPDAPWTGLAAAPSAWYLPAILEVRPSCAWTRVTPDRPSAWIETTFAGPGRLSALSAVVPWEENWIYPFGSLLATMDGAPIGESQHSLVNSALNDFLIPPGQHVVRWTLNRQDVPDDPSHVADGQLGTVVFNPRREVSLDQGLGSSGWRTSPKNPWFALQEELPGAISGPVPGSEPSWIEKSFTGPAILTFSVSRANAWTIDAPRELRLSLDNQDLPVTALSRYYNAETTPGIIPGGYSFVLPGGRHSVRWTSSTNGGLVTMKNVADRDKPSVWLAEAMGISGALILTGNMDPDNFGGWTPVTDGYRGAPAVRSGTVSTHTWMQTWVNGPAVVSFWSRSEGDHDSLTYFQVDGVTVNPAGGAYPTSREWRQTKLSLTSGRHLLRWAAIYDGIGSGYYVSRLKIAPHRSYQWSKPGQAKSGLRTPMGNAK